MNGLPVPALILVAAFAMGCVSSLEKGDEAYQRRNWDQAVERYQEALQSGVDPAKDAQTRSRLAESQAEAGKAHMLRSTQLQAAGDLEGSLREAELAYRFNPAAETASRVGEVKTLLAPRLRQQGQAEVRSGSLQSMENAVQLLARAQDLAPTAEGAVLLAQAQELLAEYRRRIFTASMQAGDAALASRNWGTAAARYQAACEAGATDEARLKADFSRSMQEAEAAVSSQQWDRARSTFEKATRMGLDSEYVRSRMYEVVPFAYEITIHEGVILPFKPDTEMPWDGLGTQRISDASKTLTALGLLTGGSTTTVAGTGELIIGGFQGQVEPPDTYLLVTLGGRTFGSRDHFVQDSFRPEWGTKMTIMGSPSDGDSLTLTVFDRDLESDDRVGSIQLSSKDLLASPGVKEYLFVTKDAQLRAGGLVALRITVERN